MIDQDILDKCVTDATTEVFAMMLGIDIAPAALGGHAASDVGVIALVGITGDWGGSGVFCCSPSLASILCARMLGGVPDPGKLVVDEEVLDVVAEVTNMMIGNVKNGLEATTGPLAISVPTVIYGRNFRFRNMCGLRGATLAFSAENEIFEVRIALAPVAEQPAARLRIPILGLAHM